MTKSPKSWQDRLTELTVIIIVKLILILILWFAWNSYAPEIFPFLPQSLIEITYSNMIILLVIIGVFLDIIMPKIIINKED